MRYLRRGARPFEPARPRHFAVVFAACLVWGCLPAGDPPPGVHVVRDRTLTAAFFAPSETGGVPSRLLASGPMRALQGLGLPGVDLFDFAYSSPGQTVAGLAGLAPTVASVVLGAETTPSGYVLHTDSKGRLIYVREDASGDDPVKQVARFDFTTGREEALANAGGPQADFSLSPSRTLLFAEHFTFDDTGVTDIGPLANTDPVFVGDRLYYATQVYSDTGTVAVSIRRKGVDTPPELLLSSTGNVTFTAIPSEQGAQLLVSWVIQGATVPNMLVDTVGLASTPLPAQRGQAQYDSASTDGLCLLFRGPGRDGASELFFFNWTDGSFTTWIVDPPNTLRESEWRPGRQQLWLTVRGGFATWSADSGFSPVMDSLPFQLTVAPEGRTSMFTRDGRHWFSMETRRLGDTVAPAVFVGDSDNPTATPLQLNPWGEQFESIWETSDGRLLVGASSLLDELRQDIYLVNPDTGTSQALAGGGHLIALGRDRALALLNWQATSSTGDLTIVELATGAQTVLAQDVCFATVDPGTTANVAADADRLAPGTKVAFLVRNRLVSPYDGLWVASLP